VAVDNGKRNGRSICREEEMIGKSSKRNSGSREIREERDSSGKLPVHFVRKLEYDKEPAFFLNITEDWDIEKFPAMWAIGNADILKSELVALFCSRKCPGKVILKSRDYADSLRIKCIPVIGGFQTPVEKMCLEMFLKGEQPVVVCPARGIQKMRVPAEWTEPVESGRMLIVSPFAARHRRVSAANAELRNKFVAAAADKLFFLHAAAKSRTLAFAEELLSHGRDVFTFAMDENRNLKDIGCGPGF
jgi:predicted Rossmann fold nucleotide-binding protein DprA/Smf involved in DNA uptake